MSTDVLLGKRKMSTDFSLGKYVRFRTSAHFLTREYLMFGIVYAYFINLSRVLLCFFPLTFHIPVEERALVFHLTHRHRRKLFSSPANIYTLVYNNI